MGLRMQLLFIINLSNIQRLKPFSKHNMHCLVVVKKKWSSKLGMLKPCGNIIDLKITIHKMSIFKNLENSL